MEEKRRRQRAASSEPARVAERPKAAAAGVVYNPDELFPKSPRLTVRERETLVLLGDGKTNEIIAAVLGNSKRTVEDHVSQILRKLDVDDRNEAMALYHHAIQTRLQAEIGELKAQILALEKQNAALRRQLRRSS